MKAVILAGGKGMRLLPFTTRLPKPLMPIGERTIIEHLLLQLRDSGVTGVIVCTAHHAELIEKVIGDGEHVGLEVSFRRDRKPGLSTLAPVREIVDELPAHFLMLNADILCDVDFGRMYRHGVDSGAAVTVAIHEEVVPGTHPRCEIGAGDRIERYDPRPTSRHWVNMGIYVLSRDALSGVPADQPYGMDTLMRDLLASGRPIDVYRSFDTWLDVGVPDELARAQELFLRSGGISGRRRAARVPLRRVVDPSAAERQAAPLHVEETGVFSINTASWGAIYKQAERDGVILAGDTARTPYTGSDRGVRIVQFVTPTPADPGLPIVMVCGAGSTALIGSERFALHLARELAVQGSRVSLVLQTPGSLDPDDVRDAVVTPLAGLDARTLLARLDAPRVVVGVDLVSPDASRVAHAAARDWGVPFVIVPASAQDAWLDPPASLEVCSSADAVFAVTAAEGRALTRNGVAPGKTRVIGYGSYVGAGTTSELSSSPPVAGDYVLFLGRKRRDKGYRELLAAAPLVWERYPDLSFVFVGPRIDADCLAWFEQVDDPRVVEAHGLSMAAKDAAVAGCTMLCLPTTSDVFPQVFIEAWRESKPVISGPFDGAREVVRHGIDGLVIEARPEPLAEAILDLLGDPVRRAAMGQAGCDRVRDELSWPAMTRRVSGLLREIVSVVD